MPELTSNSTARKERVVSIAWFVSAAVLIILLIGTHIPQTVTGTHTFHDKWLHAIAYCTLMVSLLTSCELSIGVMQPAHYFFVWLAVSACGALDELTQIPVGRVCDPIDWLCDVTGAVVGIAVYRVSRSILMPFL